ncbi:MAG: HlyD family secretion protein [Bacteroidales bacterium]|jgi:HlyD family secretion protein|nr:HlyD family secretion protein [Bacteroidales bacterium]
MKYDNPEKIELRSEEVQEILGKPPKWLISYGITVIFFIVIGLFIGSYFFKYPDILAATITVTTENLPADIVAKTSGRIDSILVRDKEKVKQGDILAIIENPADFKDVMLLRKSLEDFKINDTLHYAIIKHALQLGDIQQSYFTFLRAYEDYRFFYDNQHYQKKINLLRKQIETQKKILLKTQTQLSLSVKQLNSARQLFAIDSALYKRQVISLSDFEGAKTALLQQEQTYETAKMTLDNQQMSILQTEQSILELELQEREQENNLLLSLSGAYEQLQAQIEQWKQLYLLESSIAGIVTMTNYWQQNQNIQSGAALVTVVPDGEMHITGKIFLPLQGAGKVKEGQMVNVKFANYPHMEYGMVRVEINNISLVPVTQNDVMGYVLQVHFPDGLTTNYGKKLAFGQQMQGTADIITDDLRLLDRFLNPIRSLWKQ